MERGYKKYQGYWINYEDPPNGASFLGITVARNEKRNVPHALKALEWFETSLTVEGEFFM